MLVDANGVKKAVLKMGEQKSIQTDRVVLVAGPDEEVAIVRRIYHEFIKDGKLESEIAAGLNAQGIVTDFGRAWNRATVHQVLTNEKYIGNNVYSPDVVQTEKEARQQSAGAMDSSQRRLCGHRRDRNCSYGRGK